MFELNQVLEQDSRPIVIWPLCQVRLINDNRFPWLILVPARPDLREFHDVASDEQPPFLSEINRASQVLKQITSADKINVASLGNQVAQLHIHVIARFQTDAAWPAPAWGVGQAVPYEPAEADRLISDFLMLSSN